jgi:hypothetical protein
VRAAGQRVTLSKGSLESSRHVLMKAILWALYLPDYPTLTIEIPIEDKYKPDLVAFDPAPEIYQNTKQPLFWGESGVVGEEKMHAILRRYPSTHFAFAKWSTSLQATQRMAQDSIDEARKHRVARMAPVDLIRVPEDALERFISAKGEIEVTLDQLIWRRLEP